MGPRAETQKQKLKIYSAVFVAMGLILAANVNFFQMAAIYIVALAGVIWALAGMVLTVLGMRKAVKEDKAERIEHTAQWLAENCPSLAAGNVEITDRERAESPFLADHSIDGPIEISGTLGGTALRLREMYIFDVVHTREDSRSHREVFYGTAARFGCTGGKGEYILCSPDFHLSTKYRPDRRGYVKVSAEKKAPRLFVKTEDRQMEQTLRLLYRLAQQMAPALQSEDFAVWYKDGTAEIFFCQHSPYQNDIPQLIAETENMLHTLQA